MLDFTLSELIKKLQSKEINTVDLANFCLDNIQSRDPKIGAFLTLSEETTIKQAEEANEKILKEDTSILTGIPIAVKDNISTKNIKTTAASKVLEDYIPFFDATVVESLKRQGALFLGKTNLDEFAMGTSGQNSAFKPTYNPINLDYWPGGSSSGSAAAVAARMVPAALGSDTGGSIRLPASFCGLVGFKPSYGRCSRYGLIAYGSSLDQIGPITKNVEDAALLAHVITGYDKRDATSRNKAPINIENLKKRSLKGLKLGLPKELFGIHIQESVKKTLLNVIDSLKLAGVEFEECSVPSLEYGVATYYIIAPAEASSNLARFDGIRYGKRCKKEDHIDEVAYTRGTLFGHEVKQRMIIGTYVLSAGYYDAYYIKAQKLRLQMTQEINSLFHQYDAIFSPTSPTLPFKVKDSSLDSMTMKMFDLCTIPANLGGFPAISIPAGSVEGLPVGLQLLGPWGGDEELLQISYTIEKELAIPYFKIDPRLC